MARPFIRGAKIALADIVFAAKAANDDFTTRAMHYVYLMVSIAAPRKRYVGYTEDLRRRILDHNAGKNISTAKHRPWRLQTYLAFSTRAAALAFERYLKSGSGHAFARKRLWQSDADFASRTA